MTIQELKELYDNYKTIESKEEALEAVKQDADALRFVKDQDKDICLEAVKQNGYALQFVKDQDKDICLEAVKQDADALQFVKDHIFKDMYKELTVSQIESKLGFKIKIIK